MAWSRISTVIYTPSKNRLYLTTLVASVVALLLFGCCTSQQATRSKTVEPIRGQSVRLTVPSFFSVEEVWSPDSLVAKFVSPVEEIEIYVEVGESGYPNYSKMPEYNSSPIQIEGYNGEIVSFLDTRQDDWKYTAVLRFPNFNWVRAWSHAQSNEELEYAKKIMQTLEWSQ